MSATLRERLAAKKRRTTVQPIQLEGPSEREGELVVEYAEAAAAEVAGKKPARPSDDILAEVTELRDARYVDAEFTAMEPKVWESIVAQYPSPEGRDAGMDWRRAMPVVAAICCTDESMQDDELWLDVLEGPARDDGTRPGLWSHGELISMWNALLHLNTDAPAAHVPKG